MIERKKKLSFIITNITSCAGTERVVVTVANYLQSLGNYSIEIISLNSNQGTSFFPINDQINIRHLGCHVYNNRKIWSKIYGYWDSFFKFFSFIRNYQTDILIGTSRNTTILSLFFKKRHQKVIGCEHFSYNAPMNGLVRKVRDHVYARLDRLIVLTQTDQLYYSQKNINTIVIPNAIPFPIQACWEEKRKIALAVGRHMPEKAFDKLIRIWEKTAKNSSWKLYVVGDGDLLEKNKNLAHELHLQNIEFIQPTKHIVQYYREASIYLMTSLFEAFPMVLLEARACGGVCISYDCDLGPRQIINDRKDGFLVPVDDESDFGKKLMLLMENENLRRELGMASLKDTEKYIPENILPAWKSLFDSLV